MFKFYNDLECIEESFNELNTIHIDRNIPIVFVWNWLDIIKYSYIFKIETFNILYRHLKTEVSGSAYYKNKIYEPRNFIILYGNTKKRHVNNIKGLRKRNKALKKILLRVTLHEARHQYQYLIKNDWFVSASKNEQEDDANEYANNLLDNF
ncbi:MAG: hypothetical protein KQ78_01941 [Candidatus Izimaplasma bacterium HR2]|nr:MAG: hypothetical protein KQ78_01941 [Candidatus Izimaplasma bacterium HR2]